MFDDGNPMPEVRECVQRRKVTDEETRWLACFNLWQHDPNRLLFRSSNYTGTGCARELALTEQEYQRARDTILRKEGGLQAAVSLAATGHDPYF